MAVRKMLGAHRKKSSAKVHKPKRRRRIGAAGSSIEMVLKKGVGVGAGVVAARELGVLAGNFISSLTPTSVTTSIVQMGIGVAAMKFSKNGFVNDMGAGAFGEGILSLLQNTKVISGIGSSSSYSYRRQMGDPRLQFVAGPTDRIGSPPNPIPVVAGAGRRKRQYVS